MTFIRIQNAKKDEDGNIVGGSASIVESVYVSTGKNHCKQVLKESLGTVIFMDNKRPGIFLSKLRGLVYYDANKDEFSSVGPYSIVHFHSWIGSCQMCRSFSGLSLTPLLWLYTSSHSSNRRHVQIFEDADRAHCGAAGVHR